MSSAAASVPAYTTPTKRAAFASGPEAGPSRARPAGASPAYSSRRHSLYGVEDRVVIDPGSRIWKVGFSGEPDPRAVFWAQSEPSSSRYNTRLHPPGPSGELWDFDLGRIKGVEGRRSEGERLVGVRIVNNLRGAFVKHLMTDSKARKVIIVENTFLPTYVKEHIARALFDNLKAPSVSFTPASLLALAACGRITGLVVDVGWLETSITPVFHSRPLYSFSRTTPFAGRRLHSRLRALLRRFGTYIAPPNSTGSTNVRERAEGVPLSLLTDHFVERVLTEGCFHGAVAGRSAIEDEAMQVDPPPDLEEELFDDGIDSEALLRSLKTRYGLSSTAKDMTFKIASPPLDTTDTGLGTVIVPGWIRERAAEILLDDKEEEEDQSITQAILTTLTKLPIDLRPAMISSILVTGGSASLPGFISRLRTFLLQSLKSSTKKTDPPAPPPLNTPASRAEEARLWRQRKEEPFAELYGLVDKVAILNDPAPLDSDSSIASTEAGRSGGNGGKAPRWTPGLMSWVGGSLAGALKTGGPEILRETYDTLVAESIDRGEAWKEEQEASEVEIAALVGISIEELRAGEAMVDARPDLDDRAGEGREGEGGKDEDKDQERWKPRARRRGWKEENVIGDWSRVVKV